MAETTYHAPVYEPTVDELEVLKKLEMGESVSLESAAREHMSRRLRERGLVEVDSSRNWHITEAGRAQIRRADA
jgi:Mn-dependent DtxR family transcriptional regulator